MELDEAKSLAPDMPQQAINDSLQQAKNLQRPEAGNLAMQPELNQLIEVAQQEPCSNVALEIGTDAQSSGNFEERLTRAQQIIAMGLPPHCSDEFMRAFYEAQSHTDSGDSEASVDMQHQAQVNATMNANHQDSGVAQQS